MGISIVIGSQTIGLIVRGKASDSHAPDLMAQHADCILPNGQPVGFFGGEGDASSGSSGNSFTSWAEGPSVSWNSLGVNMKGAVAYYKDFQKIRPMYVDINLAKKFKVVSTVLLLDVSKAQADLFRQYWLNLSLNPGTFNLIGNNCSTHASDAFIAAKIVSSGIPGLDTPDNLYWQLKAKYASKIKIHSGHVGMRSINGDKYELLVE